MYGGGPARTGHVAEVDLPTDTPGVVWSIDIGAEISSSPAVVGERIVLGGADGNVYALGEKSEGIMWSVDLGSDRLTSSPAIVDNTVIIGGPDGSVHALDAETGESEWVSGTYETELSSPAVASQLAVIGTGNRLIALDTVSGGIRWGIRTAERMTSPAIAGGTAYAGSETGRLYAVGLDTGQKQWSTSFDSGSIFSAGHDNINNDYLSPLIANNWVYFQWCDSVYAVNAGTGSEQWVKSESQMSSVTVASESAFLPGLEWADSPLKV